MPKKFKLPMVKQLRHVMFGAREVFMFEGERHFLAHEKLQVLPDKLITSAGALPKDTEVTVVERDGKSTI